MLFATIRTQAETAKALGVSQGEVSKREASAIRKLNRALHKAGLKAYVSRKGLEVVIAA